MAEKKTAAKGYQKFKADLAAGTLGEVYIFCGEESYLRELLEGLISFGPRTAIITGVRSDDGRMGVVAMDAGGKLSGHWTEYIPAVFHGTGDLFASTCVGLLTLGWPTAGAIRLASEYVVQTLRATVRDRDARWYGVDFETTLPLLLSKLEKKEDI